MAGRGRRRHALVLLAMLGVVLVGGLRTVPGAHAAGRAALVLPASIERFVLVNKGLRVTVRLPRRAGLLRLTLTDSSTNRVLARRTWRLRARRGSLRWHLSSSAVLRLHSGRYVVAARAGRLSLRRAFSVFVDGMEPQSPNPAPSPTPAPTDPGPAIGPGDPVIASAGDIACDGVSPSTGPGAHDGCAQAGTAALITDVIKPNAVLGPGDFQYQYGNIGDPTTGGFRAYYDPYWGRFNNITYPINGFEHDFYGSDGAYPGNGWLTYWQHARPDLHLQQYGSYSFDLGTWHIIALNAGCYKIPNQCNIDQWTQWLANDLATHHNKCILAFAHEPLWASPNESHKTVEGDVRTWFEMLYDAGADVVIGGENHNYERFLPLNPYTDQPDPDNGLVQFVVGTGGESHYPFSGPARYRLGARNDTDFGVLRLTLDPDGYHYQFLPVTASPWNGSFTDQGFGYCH